MPGKIEVLTDLFKKVVDLHGLNPGQIIKGDDFGLPRLIPSGDGGTIQISKPIDDLITKLARILKSERPTLIRNVTEEEWRGWVRGAIGPALAETSHSDSPDVAAHALLSKVEADVDALLIDLAGREYAFGTTLFSSPSISPFSIGPVSFEPRDIWLRRKFADGSVTNIMLRRILQCWNGKRQRARKRNLDNFQENEILQAIGLSPYVCSVRIKGFAPEAGREAALSAARIALACVAMVWAKPSAVLDGFILHYDGAVHRQKALSFVQGRTILSESHLRGRLHGPRISDADWAKEFARWANYFSAAGEILQLLLSPDGAVPRANLINALMQSLLWFYEGCREQNDLLAIVDFAASLDALGGGTKASGILAVLKARLGVNETDPINPGGPTFKSILDMIYREGRSRTIHGTSVKIGHDWTRVRAISEQLSRHALFASLDWAGSNQAANKAKLLKT
jgi:hypothetical protein